jgi:hypothetical protein
MCVRDGINETDGFGEAVGEELGVPEGAWEIDGLALGYGVPGPPPPP